MSDQNFSEVDKLLSSDFDEPKKVETPKPEAEVPKTVTQVEEKQPEADMVVEEVKTTPKRGRTPKKAATPTPKKVTPKKATPTKNSPKKVEKEIVTDPLKVSTRKCTKHSDWSELIYGSSETYAEGDTLAVRAPKDSGDQFWLCALDGFGTEENNNKDDFEITWYEAKETAGVYIEGEEDDIAADSVICRTRLNIGKDGTWVLPQVELKAIRDALKLEREESSEIILEGGDDKSDEVSDKGEEEEEEDGEESKKSRPKREKEEKPEKPKREAKSGDKRKAATETNGEPKPKRAYKKREKKVTPDASTGGEGMAVETAKIESEPPTTTTTSTFPGTSINPTTPTPIMPTISMQTMPMQSMPMQSMPMHMSNHPMHQMYLHPMHQMGGYGGPIPMPNQMPMMPSQMPNHMANHHPVAMQMQVQNSSPAPNVHVPTPTPTEIANQPVESKTEAV
jgi:hypothetical protein